MSTTDNQTPEQPPQRNFDIPDPDSPEVQAMLRPSMVMGAYVEPIHWFGWLKFFRRKRKKDTAES
jgi:hypothetical protein